MNDRKQLLGRLGAFVIVCVLASSLLSAEPDAKAAPADIARDKTLLADKQQTPEARAAAAKRLREAARKDATLDVVPDLLNALKDERDSATRVAMINAKVGIVGYRNRHGGNVTYPLGLVELLFDSDANIHSLAATYVGSLGDNSIGPVPVEALPLLLKALHHGDVQVRSAAVGALSCIRVDPKLVLPDMKNALHDKAYSVRNNAAVAIWRRTKQADLVIPTFAALMGSEEPLEDSSEGCIRSLVKNRLWSGIEAKVRDKPEEVTSELIKCLHSQAKDVQRGARLLSIAFLKGKDPSLEAQRKSMRAELTRLNLAPDDETEREEKAVLGAVRPSSHEAHKP